MTDLFCGAGGSSTGAVAVPGVTIRVASNHWQLAVETHNTNHPGADHICADLSQIHPGYFPGSDIAWMSPECTFHSQARGAKAPTGQQVMFGEPLPDEAAERSRATMWDVVRFTEHHRYAAVIVENVTEVAKWPPFRSWLLAMDSLGYDHRLVSLNSAHAHTFGLPAPQSRDRLYVVFWLKGNRAPELGEVQRPVAWCDACGGLVRGRQSWKRDRGPHQVGRYRAQYVYRCPTCQRIVEPAWLPALTAIDLSLPAQRIGDRDRPLAEKTRARIAVGIARYWGPLHVEAAGNTYDAADPKHPRHGDPNSYYRAWPVMEPLRTLHTTESKALAVPVEGRDGKSASPLGLPFRTQTTRLETGVMFPFITVLRGADSTTSSSFAEPLTTITAGGQHHGLVVPYYGAATTAKPDTDPLDTLTTRDRFALVVPSGGTWNDDARPLGEPLRALTTREAYAVVTPGDIADAMARVDDVLFRMLQPSEVKRGMGLPADYTVLGTRREQVRMCGNAVTPPTARDLVWCVAESLGHTA